MLGVVRTAINHVIVEHSLTIPNVFTNLKIKGAGATKHDRLPLSDDQVVTLEAAFSRMTRLGHCMSRCVIPVRGSPKYQA